MLRLTALAAVAALAGCYADAEPLAIDDTTGDEILYVSPASDVIRFRDLELTIPGEPGAGVGAVAETADGWIQISVENQGDGIVAIQTRLPNVANSGIRDITDVGVKNRNPACSDGTYKLDGHRWATAMRWSLSTANNPSPEMEAMIKLGAQNVVSAYNDCNLADEISATQVYLGRTPYQAPATCSGVDGRSVVSLGALGGTFKAFTCWYWDATNFLSEADIRFKVDQPWLTTVDVPATCVDELHVESVATHEFGHAFGLLHPVDDHPVLTMQAGGPCDASKSSLALGDVLGLSKLY